MIVVDLGQSGSRVRFEGQTIYLDRGKLIDEDVDETLFDIFTKLPKMSSDTVSLSCSGFNGIVRKAEVIGDLCRKFFGAREVAVMDDGLAGFIGALGGRDGVVLTIGGGVVAVGGKDKKFAHRDGLGSIFGDEGGGFWLGKLAITKALGLRQGRGDDLEMLEYFAEECRAYDNLAIKNSSEGSNLAIATAKKMLEAADAGVSTATAIVDEGAFLLAQTVVATWLGCGGKRVDTTEIVVQGGLSNNESYVRKIGIEINSKLPNAVLVKSVGDNLDGAAWVAEFMRHDAPPLLLWSGL
jgi:N-acetylglucosamine kinase-like BadF-type ATPase